MRRKGQATARESWEGVPGRAGNVPHGPRRRGIYENPVSHGYKFCTGSGASPLQQQRPGGCQDEQGGQEGATVCFKTSSNTPRVVGDHARAAAHALGTKRPRCSRIQVLHGGQIPRPITSSERNVRYTRIRPEVFMEKLSQVFCSVMQHESQRLSTNRKFPSLSRAPLRVTEYVPLLVTLLLVVRGSNQ